MKYEFTFLASNILANVLVLPPHSPPGYIEIEPESCTAQHCCLKSGIQDLTVKFNNNKYEL